MALRLLLGFFTVLVVVGVGLIYLPAGVITAGLCGLIGCYVAAYFKAQEAE